ncbi:hypothetical protein F2P79_024821 [Pimephales promelas]|nr:hypothetical protein F2P79_024821 [Pimephales promelas]
MHLNNDEESENKTKTKPSNHLVSPNVDVLGILKIIDTFDRPSNASTEGTYVLSGAHAKNPINKPGERIPKAVAFAGAGVGLARAEYSVFEVEAKGPNASACAEANVVGVGAIARAEVASASAKAGPVGVKVGLGFDTGATIGLGGAEVKILGTGVRIGPNPAVSLLGSEVSCSVM